MAKKVFNCAACGESYDAEASSSECRVCHKTYCNQCIDEGGMCVPCKESKS